jgi:hypothetical protein
LKTFCAKVDLDLDASLDRLKQKGIRVNGPGQNLQSIAVLNGVSPQHIFLAMRPAVKTELPTRMPDTPPMGVGRRSLDDICQQYQINISHLVRSLDAKKIKVVPERTLQEIALQHQMAPHDLYDLVKRLSNEMQTP